MFVWKMALVIGHNSRRSFRTGVGWIRSKDGTLKPTQKKRHNWINLSVNMFRFEFKQKISREKVKRLLLLQDKLVSRYGRGTWGTNQDCVDGHGGPSGKVEAQSKVGFNFQNRREWVKGAERIGEWVKGAEQERTTGDAAVGNTLDSSLVEAIVHLQWWDFKPMVGFQSKLHEHVSASGRTRVPLSS
ncbi:hypothetical protein R6Q59_034482 [Mikania micrantha]